MAARQCLLPAFLSVVLSERLISHVLYELCDRLGEASQPAAFVIKFPGLVEPQQIVYDANLYC